MTDIPKPLMTRNQAFEFLISLGFPITEGYFNKICLPSRNGGPPVAKLWGRRPLYDADQVLAWAQAKGEFHAKGIISPDKALSLRLSAYQFSDHHIRLIEMAIEASGLRLTRVS